MMMSVILIPKDFVPHYSLRHSGHQDNKVLNSSIQPFMLSSSLYTPDIFHD
jgi:hypothetical protein